MTVKRHVSAYGDAAFKDLRLAPLQGMDVAEWALREEVEEARWRRNIKDVMTDKAVIHRELRRHHVLDRGYAAEFMEPAADEPSRQDVLFLERARSLRGFLGGKG